MLNLFRPAKPSDVNKVLIQNNQTDNGCWSSVGKQNGTQVLEISDWCFNNRSVPHELLHAAGIYHEHARPDRDDFIEVHNDCITDGYENNFIYLAHCTLC